MPLIMSDAYRVFQSDPGREEVWLLELEALNTVTDEDVTLYFSSAQYGTGPDDDPPHRAYKACIVGGFEMFSPVEMSGGPLYGNLPSRAVASMVLAQTLGDLDLGTAPMLDGYPMHVYAFSGRGAVVRHGGYSPALGRSLTYAEFYSPFVGTSEGRAVVGVDEVLIRLRPKDTSFQFPINTYTYYGCKGAVLFSSRTVGTNQVAAGTNAVFDSIAAGPFSWEFLAYFHDNPTADEVLISRGLIGTDGYAIQRLTTGAIRFSTSQAGASQFTVSSAFPLKRWQRISVIRDGAAATIRFGSVDSTVTHGTHIDPTSNPARVLYFGRNNGGTVFTKAMMSDIRCWDIAITEGGILSNMHRPLDSSEYATTGLVGYWPADDGTGSTLAQKVVATTSSDGTLSGGAVFSPSLMGSTDLQGSLIPHTWGYFDGFAPQLVDEGRQIYQVHSGPVEAIDRVDIGGGPASTLDGASPYTDLIEMLATTTASGKHSTCITSGGTYVRFGSLPSHPVTIGGRGDNTGGVFRYTVSDLVRFIICNTGWYPLTDPTDLDTDSFDDLAVASTAQVGLTYKGEKSVDEVVNFFLQTVGAVGFFTREGVYAVKQIVTIDDAGDGILTITEEDIDQSEFEPSEELSVPIFRVDLQYKENPTVLAITDMTIGVAGTARENFVNKPWRKTYQVDHRAKEDDNDAKTLIYKTAFYVWFDAMSETIRQLALWSTRAQLLTMKVKQGKVDLDRLDVVYFDFADLDEHGARQNRFQSGPTYKMYVLDVSDDQETGGCVITLWRDNA